MATIATDDGIALRYELEGPEGAPVLLLSNSLGTDLSMWDDQLAAFTATHRVLRYDSRGHGASGAPEGPYSIERLGRDVLALLDALDLQKVDYCGLSKGGMVGMWLGVNAPARFGRMVFANTAAHLPTEEMWRHRAATVRSEGMAAIEAAVVNRWFTEAFQAAAPERVDRIRQVILTTPAEGYAACCEAIAAMDQRETIKAISAPVLVIAGAADPATPPDHAHQIAEAIEGAQLAVLPDAAHLSNIEQTDLFNAAVAEFLTA